MSAIQPAAHRVALAMFARWMSERFFRTFKPVEGEPAPFDAVLSHRDVRAGVTIAALWKEDAPPAAESAPATGSEAGGGSFERLVAADLEAAGTAGGYVLWVPPGASVPEQEPRSSEFRLLVSAGLRALKPDERRELRIPVTLQLAQVAGEGAYVAVTGGLSGHWTRLSDNIGGEYRLDSRTIHRLPEEEAELEILISQVRDRAAALNPQEVVDIASHDHWLVSRLPDGSPDGLTLLGAPPAFDTRDGAGVRRLMRRGISRAAEQRREGGCDFATLLLIGAIGHIGDEMTTAALRGMSPTAYASLDLIALVADGQVRQVLQPRSLPWGD